jgi:DNA repair photolyase
MTDEIRQPPARIKGRGAASNTEGRFETVCKQAEDDGWFRESEEVRPPTQVTEERARSIISHNDSPDVSFTSSINPYRGCEHGCIYCYARPSHGYLNLSAGLDFETKLFAKTNGPEQLRAELAKPGYVVDPITIGGNTDPYQPIEKRYEVTRGIIRVLAETGHPFNLITKNAMVERDIDLLADCAKRNLVHCFVSVTSLDNQLSSRLEPRASAPHRRIAAIRALTEAGIPCGVMVAPIIPMITDKDMEEILALARAAGARAAGYVLIRLPHEVKDLFREWLEVHYPQRAAHVMSLINQMRGGRDYDSAWGRRMRGEGVFAQLIERRFTTARARLGYDDEPRLDLDRKAFVAPRKPSPQGELF